MTYTFTFLYLRCPQVVCITFISYMCLCAYYTIFKLRLFNLYYMAPAQQTDDYSLLFSGLRLSTFRITSLLVLSCYSCIETKLRVQELIHFDNNYLI